MRCLLGVFVRLVSTDLIYIHTNPSIDCTWSLRFTDNDTKKYPLALSDFMALKIKHASMNTHSEHRNSTQGVIYQQKLQIALERCSALMCRCK